MSEAWYERWFGERYLEVYEHRDRAEAERFVETILAHAQLPPGARVLDVACGRGRHALRFARAGLRVMGIDLSLPLLARGREALREHTGGGAVEEAGPGEPPRLLLVQADMRELPAFEGPRGADLVVNLFTAFGYFEDEEEDALALDQMARCLKPGGRLVLDFMNRPRVVGELVEEDAEEREGFRVRQQRSLTDGERRVEKRIILEYADGRVEEHTESVRLYAREDLERLACYAGLEVESFWGDYEGADHTPSSPRCILVARRPM